MAEHILTFIVKLLDDSHLGSGEGRLGVVDDTHSRDALGDPVCRWTAVQGVLREAADDWLLRLQRIDRKKADEYRALLDELLGAPGDKPGSATISSWRLDKRQTGLDRRPLFLIGTSTSREAYRRRPDDGTLRTIEFAAAGLAFTGQIRLPAITADGAREKDLERVDLVQQCLRRVVAIGGGKTRGAGRILLSAESAKASKTRAVKVQKLPANGPVCLRILLRNVEPLNLAATGFAGNIVPTQTFPSGSRLRGALLHWIARRDPAGKLADQLASPTALRVANAYPLPKMLRDQWKGVLTLPVPLSIRQRKHSAPANQTPGVLRPWWSATSATDNNLGDHEERDELLNPGKSAFEDERVKEEAYLSQASRQGGWLRHSTEVAVSMRNSVPTSRRDPDREFTDDPEVPHVNPNTRPDALFSQESLVEDQWFVGELIFSSNDSAQKFLDLAGELLDGDIATRSWLPVGRHRMPMVVEDWYVVDSEDPRRGAAGDSASGDSALIHVVLSSDLIARSPELAFMTSLDLESLKSLILDAWPQQMTSPPPKLATRGLVLHARFETTEIHAFNSATGLPRAAALALKRGSAFVLRADNSHAVDNSQTVGNPQGAEILATWRDALVQLAANGVGLGERTAEGFGRFVVDPNWQAGSGQQNDQRSQGDLPVNWREVVLSDVEQIASQVIKESRDKKGESKDAKFPTVSQWRWLRERCSMVRDANDWQSLWKELEEHAARLAGAIWKGWAERLENQLNGYQGALDREKYFMDQFCRHMVVEVRRRTETTT